VAWTSIRHFRSQTLLQYLECTHGYISRSLQINRSFPSTPCLASVAWRLHAFPTFKAHDGTSSPPGLRRTSQNLPDLALLLVITAWLPCADIAFQSFQRPYQLRPPSKQSGSSAPSDLVRNLRVFLHFTEKAAGFTNLADVTSMAHTSPHFLNGIPALPPTTMVGLADCVGPPLALVDVTARTWLPHE